MDTCADALCTCGKHECIHKRSRNPIKPIVYKTGLPQTEAQEMYCSHAYESSTRSFAEPCFPQEANAINCNAYEPSTRSCAEPCLRKEANAINCNIKHPSHTHIKYQHCPGHHKCPDVADEVDTCDHGPYIPKTSPYPKPVCHPDRPTVIGLQKTTEHDNKNCTKCSHVFSGLNSLWEKHPPPKRTDDLLEECRDIGVDCHCDHNVALECCCRCCTCRGCPTCRTQQNCHPCHFLPYARDCSSAATPAKMRIGGECYVCAKHPCGCFFAPNVNPE